MLTRTNKWSWLKAWAMKIARQRGIKKAIRGAGTSVGRDYAPLIWVDGTEFSAGTLGEARSGMRAVQDPITTGEPRGFSTEPVEWMSLAGSDGMEG